MAEGEGETYKIMDLSKIPSGKEGRVGKYDLIISYQDSAGRMRTTEIPYEDYEGKTEEEQFELIREAIRKAEEERQRHMGKEVTIS